MHGPLLVIYLKLNIYYKRKNNVHSFLNRWIFLISYQLRLIRPEIQQRNSLRLKSLELSPLAFVKLKPSFLFLFTRIHTKK